MTEKSTPPPPVKKVPLPLPPKVTAPPPTAVNRATKKFTVQEWSGDIEGEKIILYGKSGMGKTTLASMTPNPVFIGLDDGGRKICNPITGKNLQRIPEVETFQDVRDVLHQTNLFDNCKTIIIDTVTQLQHLGLLYTFSTIKGPNHSTCTNIEQYGYAKGYRHLYDTMHHILGDLDPLVRLGKNIILIGQMSPVKVSNPGGEDYLEDAPELQSKQNGNILADYVSWADHVFKIDHADLQTTEGKAASTGKRCIRVHPEIHFEAKSRTLGPKLAIVSFETAQDDSIWQFLFGDKRCSN